MRIGVGVDVEEGAGVGGWIVEVDTGVCVGVTGVGGGEVGVEEGAGVGHRTLVATCTERLPLGWSKRPVLTIFPHDTATPITDTLAEPLTKSVWLSLRWRF